ncbi:MAG: Outer rane cobalamin receptor protein [Adhaeribacter sp.]|nr:Outer rane cobalamin receptor protein [Adhaeribacter sp.]
MKKKILAIQTWIATGTILCICISVNAQQTDSLRTEPLPEVIFTATRAPKPVSEIGRSVTVISSEQIQNSIYNNAGELLSQQEGIYVVGTGQNPGMTQSIFMRGAGSSQTVILVDGIRVTDPSGVNNALDLSELALTNIDRIEIVRGSHSTLYGSSAIGGVVNIITKKNNKPGFNGIAEIKGGTFGKSTSVFAQNLDLNYSFKNGLYANAQVNNQNIQGLDATLDTLRAKNIYNKRDQDNYKRLDLGSKIGYRTEKIDIYGSFKNTNFKTDLDKGAFTDDDNAVLDFNRDLFTYGASYKLNPKLNLSYIGGYSTMHRKVVDDSSSVDERGTSDHTFFSSFGKGSMGTHELQAAFTTSLFNAVVGLGHYRETMNAGNYYYSNSAYGAYESASDLDTLGLKATTKNIFAHVDLNGGLLSKHLKNLNLALGSRYNTHSKFGNFTTYEINPSYKLTPKTLVFASLSTGYNAPSLFHLFAPNKNFTSGLTRGNPDLKPEVSESYEIGFKQSIQNLSFGVSYFKTSVSNSIEYVNLWAPDKPVSALTYVDFRGDRPLNLSRQVNRGFEFDVKTNLSAKFYLAGNFSLVRGRLTVKPSDINAAQTGGNQVQLYNTGVFIDNKAVEIAGLVRRPNTANISLTYLPLPKLSFRLDSRYAGNRKDSFYDADLGPFGATGTKEVGEYTLFDFSGRFTITPHLIAGLRLENLLNNSYSEINGYTTRGRGLYLNLRYTL